MFMNDNLSGMSCPVNHSWCPRQGRTLQNSMECCLVRAEDCVKRWGVRKRKSVGSPSPSYGYNRVRSTNCTRATRCSSLLVLEKSTTHQRGVLTYWYWWTRTFYKNKNRCLVLFSSFTLSLWSNVANFQWAKSPKREFPAVSKKFADTEI